MAGAGGCLSRPGPAGSGDGAGPPPRLAEVGGPGQALTDPVLGRLSRWDFALDRDGRPWLAYYGADGTLFVRRPDGSRVDLRPRTRASAMSGLAMAVADGRLDLVWRDKLPAKGLYYTSVGASPGAAGEPGEPLLIDAETEPLTRMRVAALGDETYVLWYGERRGAGGRRHYDYHLRAVDRTGRLSDRHEVMPGIYPTWIVDEREIAIFSYTVLDGRPVMAMRRFDRAEGRLGAIRTVAEVPPVGPLVLAFRSSERWFLMWVGHHGPGFRHLLLEGVRSDDRGATWRPFTFPELQGLDFSQIDAAADGRGRVLVAASGAWALRDPGAQRDVYVLHSADDGETWSAPRRLRPDAARVADADFPSVVFGTREGTAMVVWEDRRDVRANVYASYSEDGGATWSAEPLPVGLPGARNLGLDFGVQTLRAHGGRFQVVARRFTGDDLALSDLVRYSFTAPELQAFAARARQVAPAGTEARLRERIDAYWRAQEGGDLGAAYALLDPFFRSRQRPEAYRARRGRIRYHGHAIRAVRLDERIARVGVEVVASVPEFTLGTGAVVARPPASYDVAETWLFVDGDWYREHREAPGDLDTPPS